MRQGVLENKAGGTDEIHDIRNESDGDFLRRCRGQRDALEKIRRKKLQEYNFCKWTLAAMALMPVFVYVSYRSGLITFALLFCVSGWEVWAKARYNKAYKHEILSSFAKLFGHLTYRYDAQIPVEDMRQSLILPAHDKYTTDDYFEGTYKGVSVRFAEVNFAVKSNRDYRSTFSGLVILLEMKAKRFYGNTILESKRLVNLAERILGKSGDLDSVNLVDPEFGKLFNVYTSDQVEARYLMCPTVIEGIKKMQEGYKSKDIRLSFYNNKILVFIRSTHNHFEQADIFVPTKDIAPILAMREEIVGILKVIDGLDVYDPIKAHMAV